MKLPTGWRSGYRGAIAQELFADMANVRRYEQMAKKRRCNAKNKEQASDDCKRRTGFLDAKCNGNSRRLTGSEGR